MTDLDDLIAQIPLDQVSRALGVDEATAAEAVRTTVPALVGGMQANAEDPAGAQSLMSALDQHSTRPFKSMFDVYAQDTADGQKIVRNVFGSNTDQVVNTLSGARTALGSGIVAKLLPILAPIVLQWLASKWSQRSASKGATAPSGGGVGQAPAGFPTSQGNASAPAQSAPAQQSGGLGDLLGGLLGGSGGGLGDLLGGLLGGGRR